MSHLPPRIGVNSEKTKKYEEGNHQTNVLLNCMICRTLVTLVVSTRAKLSAS